MLPTEVKAFGLSVRLLWQSIPIPYKKQAFYECKPNQFFLAIPDVARFLVLPQKNLIIIEALTQPVNIEVLNTWLLGTLMAYILQYHNYLVLHGSAVLINNRAVILSGQSGAGKSTLAAALVKQGHPLITDDVVVIKRNAQNQYHMIPGPNRLKLWDDAMQHLHHDTHQAIPVNLKINKYGISVPHHINTRNIPISAFYELNHNKQGITHTSEKLCLTQALKTLMQNAYRYFMLAPLGKLPLFLNDCAMFSKNITVHQLHRASGFNDLPNILERITSEQGALHEA